MVALSPAKISFAIAVSAALVVGILGGVLLSNTVMPPAPKATSTTTPEVILQPGSPLPCSWHDNPFEGVDAGEAAGLTLLDACGTVRGTVTQIVVEVRGEHTTYHFALKPDAAYATMVNSVNNDQVGGALIVEIAISDAAVLPRLHINQHLEVQGPLVTDSGHGWNEIHPAKFVQTL